MGGKRKQAELILLNIFLIVWKKRKERMFNGVDNVDGFDLPENRWFWNLSFLLLGYPLHLRRI